jgi:serine/threonine protein kinase
MNCAECNVDLNDATLLKDGGCQCPNCGHLNYQASHGEEETATFAASSPLGPSLQGRFEINKIAGRGSYGIVYRAWDKKLQRFVAVKVPLGKLNDSELFLREARAASHLRHRNIVTIFDIISANGHSCIISDFIDGISMRMWLERNPLSCDAACKLMIVIARAIEYAHGMGVVHRDIKPGNIVISPDNEPHILDFGLSHSRSRNLEPIAKHGQPIGTPAFMAPEQVRGDIMHVGPQTDCYALGVILFQMLTRRLPFYGESKVIYESILNTAPPELSELLPAIPPSLNAIVHKSLEKQPEKRFQNAGEFADELERFVKGQRVLCYSGFDARHASKVLRRNVLGLATVGLAGGLGGALFWIYRKRTIEEPIRNVQVACNGTTSKLLWSLIDSTTGSPVTDEPTETVSNGKIKLRPGFYRVIVRDGADQCEYFRTVPQQGAMARIDIDGVRPNHLFWRIRSGQVELPMFGFVPSQQVQEGMVFFAGGSLTTQTDLGLALGGKTHTLQSFLMDSREVTFGQMREQFPDLRIARDQPDSAIANRLTFDMALAFAESVGKSLPTFWEYLWAATNQSKTKYPWGDDAKFAEAYWSQTGVDREKNSSAKEDFDRTLSNPSVFGLYSSVGEWTESPAPVFPKIGSQQFTSPTNGGNLLMERAVVGMPREILTEQTPQKLRPDLFEFRTVNFASRFIGFRCVRRLSTS